MTNSPSPNPPLVSVVLSVFNNERDLPGALASLQQQTLRDIEIIAINDGSTDKSGEILESFSRTDSRIKVIHQENRGLAAALARGCDVARAPFIARQDADDVSAPERLNDQLALMQSNPQCVLSGCWTWFANEERSLLLAGEVPDDSERLKSFLYGGVNPLVHGSVMFRTDAYRSLATGYRFSNPVQDFDLWLRLGALGEIRMLEKVSYFYRMHSSSISATTFVFRQRLVNLALQLEHERRILGAELPETVELMDATSVAARTAQLPPEDFGSYSAAIECLRSGDRKTYMELMRKVSIGNGVLAKRARWHLRLAFFPALLVTWYQWRLRKAPGLHIRKLPNGTTLNDQIVRLWSSDLSQSDAHPN